MKFEKETGEILSCAFEVANSLGHGLLEKPYENALVVEMALREIPVEQQKRFDVVFKDVVVGEYIPDLIAFGNIIVEVKTIESISDSELGQVINYLKISGFEVGLIVNFKHPKVTWKRVINY
ncbi:MAG: GxxExxY protein [Verrucomicrobiales bacterium]|nr:GxxExxY protein [Verrucomicrobiales bacterium]